MSAVTPRRYKVFGGVLLTTLEMPELHQAPDDEQDTWSLTLRDCDAPKEELSLAGSEEVAGGVSISLFHAADGASRLTYSDTGTFRISRCGHAIDWYVPDNVREDLARMDVLGRVLSVAAHADGLLMLHASAVAWDEAAVGFLAPKFFGKSTLACALTDAGARLVTDDALAVRVGRTVDCAPGVPALRLRSESAARLRGSAWPASDENASWRHVERRDPDEVADDWLRLGALYILQPAPAESMESAAQRTRLPAMAAALALVSFAKLGGLLRGSMAADSLTRAVDVATSVPVYALRYARSMDRLDEVAETVAEWHRA